MSRSTIGKDSLTKGKQFEKEMANSWSHVKDSWRLRLSDVSSGERPADELILVSDYRLLIEYKVTGQQSISKSNFKDHQLRAACDFVKLHPNNASVTLVKFTNWDTVYAIDTLSLVAYFERIKKSIHHNVMSTGFGTLVERSAWGYNLTDIFKEISKIYAKEYYKRFKNGSVGI
jgi:hypothetical protein